MDMEKVAIGVAGVATAFTCAATWQLVSAHRRVWTNPKQQRLIVSIVAMVPLFAIDSLIGLLDIEASETVVMMLDAIKECYEAWVLMSFLKLMYAYLEVDFGAVPEHLKETVLHQTFPFSLLLPNWKLTPKGMHHTPPLPPPLSTILLLLSDCVSRTHSAVLCAVCVVQWCVRCTIGHCSS